MWSSVDATEYRWGYRWWGCRTGPRVPWHSADRILPAIDCGPITEGGHLQRNISERKYAGDAGEELEPYSSPLALPPAPLPQMLTDGQPQRNIAEQKDVADLGEEVELNYSPLALPAYPIGVIDYAEPKLQVSPKGKQRELKRFNRLIETCGRRGMWHQAVKVPGEMREFGVQPDATTYNQVIKACTSADRLDVALGVLDEMAQLGFVPDLPTFGVLMASCSKLEHWETALRLLVVMRESGQPLDDGIYVEVLAACVRGQQYGIVLKLLEEMRQDGVAPETISFWRQRLAQHMQRPASWQKWEQFRAKQQPLPTAVDGPTYNILEKRIREFRDFRASFEEFFPDPNRTAVPP